MPFYGFDHVELVTRHGDGCLGDYRSWLLDRAPGADRLIGAKNQLAHDYSCPQAIRTALPEELYPTRYIAERAAAWLDENAGGEDPFFLMVSFPDPHHPFTPPGRYWDMYDPEDMETPAAFARNDWTPPPHVAALHRARQEGRADLGAMGAIGTSEREAREARALTCGMIAMIDDAVGAVRTHYSVEDTVTIFTSDHGDHLGDHRLLFKGPAQYDELTRVPFIWSDAGQAGARRQEAIGQTHDIGVTILERARIMPAMGMQGRSLISDRREAAFLQFDQQMVNPGLNMPPRVHTIRTARWRLSVYDAFDEGELYDLETDRGEFVNLWNNPAHSATRARLTEALLRQEIAHVDRAPLPTNKA